MDNIENILTFNSINSVNKLVEHYYDLHKYINPNLFNLIDNYQLIIYFTVILIISYIAKNKKYIIYNNIYISIYTIVI